MHAERFKNPSGLDETLGISYEVLEPDRVIASLEVSERFHQPFGRMHGGISLALAEGVASVGGNLNCPDGTIAVGAEINANHLRPVVAGRLRAEARPIQIGRSLHVWDVRISDESDHTVCVARCTLAIIPQK